MVLCAVPATPTGASAKWGLPRTGRADRWACRTNGHDEPGPGRGADPCAAWPDRAADPRDHGVSRRTSRPAASAAGSPTKAWCAASTDPRNDPLTVNRLCRRALLRTLEATNPSSRSRSTVTTPTARSAGPRWLALRWAARRHDAVRAQFRRVGATGNCPRSLERPNVRSATSPTRPTPHTRRPPDPTIAPQHGGRSPRIHDGRHILGPPATASIVHRAQARAACRVRLTLRPCDVGCERLRHLVCY